MKRLVPVVPYGYRLSGARLVPEPTEQAVIAIVRDGRARDVSFAKLAAELTERGYRTRAGNPFNQTAVFLLARTLADRSAA